MTVKMFGLLYFLMLFYGNNKIYYDEDEIRTHVGTTHWIRQSNALTTRPPRQIQ
jgi:hypothetical protein